jgi:hypothetical protein
MSDEKIVQRRIVGVLRDSLTSETSEEYVRSAGFSGDVGAIVSAAKKYRVAYDAANDGGERGAVVSELYERAKELAVSGDVTLGAVDPLENEMDPRKLAEAYGPRR